MTATKDGGAAFPQLELAAGERDGHGDAIEAYTVASGGRWFDVLGQFLQKGTC